MAASLGRGLAARFHHLAGPAAVSVSGT